MNKAGKRSSSVIVIYAIVFVLYALIFTLIPFAKNASSWVAFAFTLIAIAASLGITWYAFRDGTELKSKLYGFSVFRIGAIYAAAQFVLGVVICLISAFVNMPYWIVLVLSLILMAFAAIGVIATDSVRDSVEEQEDVIERTTKPTKMFRLNIASVVNLCKDDAVRKEAEKLAEAFRFSDPVSSEKTEAAEAAITGELAVLREMIPAAEKEAVLAQVQKIKNLLAERNRLCKMYK